MTPQGLKSDLFKNYMLISGRARAKIQVFLLLNLGIANVFEGLCLLLLVNI